MAFTISSFKSGSKKLQGNFAYFLARLDSARLGSKMPDSARLEIFYIPRLVARLDSRFDGSGSARPFSGSEGLY